MIGDREVSGAKLRSMSSSGCADGSASGLNRGRIAMPSKRKEHYELGNDRLMSSQFFDICEEEGIDRGIDFLHKKGRLYDVLLSKNEDQDTPLHVAIKRNNVDLTKEILRILDKPYSSHYDKYFRHEKPLSKVINTQNKEEKDVITLAIEGNNKECISTVFKHLTCKDFNRGKNVESGYTPLHEAVLSEKSNAVRELLKSEHVDVELLDGSFHEACDYVGDKEIIKLLIEYCNNKVNKFGKLANSNKGPTRTESYLNKIQLFCASFQGVAFPVAFGAVIYDIQSDSAPHSGFTINHISHIATSFAVITSCVNILSGRKASECKEERLKGEKKFNSWRERRGRLENKLSYVMREIEDKNREIKDKNREIKELKKMIPQFKKLNLQEASASQQQSAKATTNGQPSSELSASETSQRFYELANTV